MALNPERVRRLFSSVPVNGFLGFELLSCEEGSCLMSMLPREQYRQEGGVVQGGIVAAFADTASAYAFVSSLGESETMTGVEFKVNFLEPAVIDGGTLEAKADVVRRGRRLGIAEVTVSQGGRLVLTGLFTYLFKQRRKTLEVARAAPRR